jgi:hypothetical protein
MKMLIMLVAVVAFGLFLAMGDRGNSSAQGDSGITQQIDSYLEKGLTPETHETISSKARASADWLRGIPHHALGATE